MILDIQKDFTGAHARMPVDAVQAETMIQNLNETMDRTADDNVNFVYISNEFKKGDLLNVFRNFAAVEGSPGAKMDERLKIKPGRYFSKNRPSAFSNSGLDDYLKSLGVNEIAIGGVKAEACVSATVKAAIQKGYKVTVLEDCIATTSDTLRARVIKKLKNRGAEIGASAEVFQG